jgi:hypothetical protein
LDLSKEYNGDAHLIYQEFKKKYGDKAYVRKKIYDFLVDNNVIDQNKWYLYLDIYCPYNKEITWDQAFEIFTQTPQDKFLSISFNKEMTKKLFVYWAENNNFDLSRESLLSREEFRKDFLKSRLEVSIRKNYKYTYMFIADLLNDPDLKPYHTSIQVPDHYWYNKENYFKLLDECVPKMIFDGTIDSPEDILYLSNNILNEYVYHCCFHSGIKLLFKEYLKSRNIEYNEKKVKYYDGFYFDSQEEMRVYKFIKKLGYKIEKCPKFNKYYNDKYDEYYIPDFKIIVNDKEYICEYFGLYSSRYSNKIIESYKIRADRKIEYFSSYFNFIYFLPADFIKGLIGIKKKLEEGGNN